ncbi:MAG: hypothetical protein K9M08_15355 [Pirellula sp.]|nr:hypothetical protein [Pirellula sp.]
MLSRRVFEIAKLLSFDLLLGLSVFFLVVPIEKAESQQSSRTRLAVDILNLKSRQQFRGFVLNANTNEDLKIAVSREWFQHFDEKAYAKVDKEAKSEEERARQQLKSRLEQLTSTGKHPALDFFVKKELERVTAAIDAPPDDECQFLVVRLKRSLIANFILASESNRRVAIWGWSERLPKIESREVSDILKELKSKVQDFDATLTVPDLSTRFPMMEQSELQWRTRLAIVSHGLAERIEFQGSGKMMIQVGDDKQPQNANEIMTQMLQAQTESVLGELLGDPKSKSLLPDGKSDWVKAAIVKTEALGMGYFHATNVKVDPLGEIASVESVFMVKHADGDWRMAWNGIRDERASQQTADSIARVTKDSQIESLKNSLQAIVGINDAFDKAIRFGAATMTAQQNVNEQFETFVERYLRRLDGPPL